MMQNRLLAAWLRPVAGLFALVAALALSACGGGSGAPNNPYEPPPPVIPALLVLPAAPTIYSQVAATLTISGGVTPYRAFSSNAAVLPVTQNLPGNTLTLLAGTVNELTTATITIQDAVGSTISVNVTIVPGPATPPPELVVLPSAIDVYSTVAAQLTISGGVPPYRAFSNNSSVLPVAQNVSGNTLMLLANTVAANTSVVVTIQDAVAQTVPVNVTVHPKGAAGPPLVVLPDTVTMSKDAPVTLTISGGTAPYQAYSSNPAVLPVAQSVSGSSIVLTAAGVAADTDVSITVQDSAGQTVQVAVTVTPLPSTPPPPLAILPSTSVAFSGVPTVLSVTGGVPPYFAFSSNSIVLPVTQAVAGASIPLLPATVAADTPVTITVQDSASTAVTAGVTVRPAALLNNLTIRPNTTDCGTSAICSGQTGTATITTRLPGGGPAPGRQVRYDVVGQAPYGIVSNNTTVQSLVVVSDANGNAQVIIRANVSAPTQVVQIRVTDVASGQSVTGDFLIQQRTDGGSVLTVIPSEVNITGPFVGECSAGFRIDYFVYGGTPPYSVTRTFPDAATLLNSIVPASGGFFRVLTNGVCVNPMTFSITDATGLVTTATLNNVPGTTPVPVAPEPTELVVVPGNQSVVSDFCESLQFQFVITGGTRPYNIYASPTGPTISNPVINPSEDDPSTIVGNITVNPTAVSFVDSSNPPKTVTRTIACIATPITPP